MTASFSWTATTSMHRVRGRRASVAITLDGDPARLITHTSSSAVWRLVKPAAVVIVEPFDETLPLRGVLIAWASPAEMLVSV